MTEHDRALVERLRDRRASETVEADDPAAVAAALEADGARVLAPADVGEWLQEAATLRSLADDVLAAEEVVARAEAAERARRDALLAGPRGPQDEPSDDLTQPDEPAEDDGPHADRASVRFALVVLGLAQAGGLAVSAADGMLVAAAAPALAIVGVAAVALAHRTPGAPDRSAAPEHEGGAGPDAGAAAGSTPPDGTAAVPVGPVVRAAAAHLRRREAAWKVAWWERGLPPADVSSWVGPPRTDEAPATLVVPDPDGEIAASEVETMVAAVPAAVRVVVVRGRPA